jgi:hypothetical protein
MRLYSLDARQNPHLPFLYAKRKRGEGENMTISLTDPFTSLAPRHSGRALDSILSDRASL